MSSILQIKGVPPEVRKGLEAGAAENFRSLNQEALAILAEHCAARDRLARLIDDGLASESRAYRPGMAKALAKTLLKGTKCRRPA